MFEFTIYDCLIKIKPHQILLLSSLFITLVYSARIPEFRMWFSFLCFCIIIELPVLRYFNCTYGNNSLPNNLYITTISWFYIYFFQDALSFMIKLPIVKLCTILVGSFLVYLFSQDLWMLHVGPYLIGLTITTILISFYLFENLSNQRFKHIVVAPKLWLGLGIILFTAVNFPFLLHIEEIRYSASLATPLYQIVALSNIVLAFSYFMYTICHLPIRSYSIK